MALGWLDKSVTEDTKRPENLDTNLELQNSFHRLVDTMVETGAWV